MIPLETEWPQHINSPLANTTQLWYGLDSIDNFKKNSNDPDKLKKLQEYNWVNTTIEYKFNRQGFRSIEFDLEVPSGLAIGCSFTQGVGVRNEDAWPTLVNKQLNIPVWNLGIGGSSLDTAFRLLDYWLPILKPKFVMHASTFTTRIELCKHNGFFITCAPNTIHSDFSFYKEWIAHPANSVLNARKNLLAIDNICSFYNIPIVTLPIEVHFISDKAGRDLAHPGPAAHSKFANKMIQQLEGLI
jgi:hypothetical protein